MRSSGMVTVNVVGACPVRSLSGASVELRSSKSTVLAHALTGSDGSATFSTAVFQRAAVVVVCHESFFCGVLELTTHTGSRFFIALAPAMLSSNHIGDNGRAWPQYGAAVAQLEDEVKARRSRARNTVDVPVYIRDLSGTSLSRDQTECSKIQAFSISRLPIHHGTVSIVDPFQEPDPVHARGDLVTQQVITLNGSASYGSTSRSFLIPA